MELQVMLEPVGLKRRYVDTLGQLPSYFTRAELEGCLMAVIFKSIVVGYLDTAKMLDELYQ